jgi:hypothetical protein
VPDGTFPVPSQREDLRVRQGTASVIVNPEDFSVAIGIRQQAVTVGSSATALPTSPLEFRRAIVIHNLGTASIFIGGSDVTLANGLPLLAGEKISFDIQGTPNVAIFGIAAGDTDVRILEVA